MCLWQCFVKGAFVTLGVGSDLAPSDLLCDFSFPSYARSLKLPPSQFPTQLTALHLTALFKTSVPVVSALLEAGSDPNARDSKHKSALHHAAEYNTQFIPLLIQYGAEVNFLDQYNNSPLFWAAKSNDRYAVVALCNAGSDPRLGRNPLRYSNCNSDIKEIIKNVMQAATLGWVEIH